MPRRPLLHVSPAGRSAPEAVRRFASSHGFEVVDVADAAEVQVRVGRMPPAALVLDASAPADEVLRLCRAMKRDAFTAVVPVVAYTGRDGEEGAVAGLQAGADEVLTEAMSERERELRLRMALVRAERDVSVHPTTLLPGTVQIERDMAERLRSGEGFAVCYADLDHFKEFNDRYGYNRGDRVILLLSRMLREIVRAHSPTAFVGHVGGDDFIFNTPLADFRLCCEEVIEVFDELMPYQYTPEDRERGCFYGKDRRGETYAVPLMTLSIGVVTNQHRSFEHPAQIGALATEMKSYAKTLQGSVYAVDRRGGPPRDG